MTGRLLSSLPVRPRTAIALLLLAVVGLVIVMGKLLSNGPPPLAGNGQAALSTVDPSTGNDSVVNLNPSPSLKQPAGGQTALTVATRFAENWIAKDRSASAWRTTLAPMSTKTLTLELAGADPISVPARRITGPAITEVHAETTVEIVFPMDAGKLRLRLIFAETRWLVDGIDWERR